MAGLVLLVAVSAPDAAGRQGRAGGRGAEARVRKALLAWADTRNGQAQHAFTSHALAVVERLGYESGLWDTYIRTDSHIIFNQARKTDGTPASGGPSLSSVDGIFFLGHREVPLDDQQKKELLAFVRSGKGFVAAHTGLTAFESWPEFGEMLGATYGGHLYTGPGRMINERATHPIVRHWGSVAEYTDEFYLAKGLSRDKVDVLLRFDPASAAKASLPADGDFPLVWTKTYGGGRVVYSSLSHSTEAWDIRNVQIMMFEAIKWSLGLSEAPVQPHAKSVPAG
ncbi:MAG TPA: ThuA domain-containing protein [Vicinamibacterales bacterium]|nr:ThuA domain-containing protein [Vicinamibacterales bacterium]